MISPLEPEGDDLPQRVVLVSDPVLVRHLAVKVYLPVHRVIATLMELNVFVTQNTEIDFLTAATVCSRHGFVARPIT